MFAGEFTLSSWLLLVSQTQAFIPKEFWASDMRIRPLGSWLTWTGTSGSEMIPDHTPFAAGLPGLALLKLTVTGEAKPEPGAPLIALAPSWWEPLAKAVVSTLKVAGLDPAVAISAPSTTSWMDWMLESGSVAVTVTDAVPLRVAPGAGLVMLT